MNRVRFFLGIITFIFIWSFMVWNQDFEIVIPDDKIEDRYLFHVISEAYERSGVTISFKAYPVKRGNSIANSGIVDGVMLRQEGIEEEFPNLVKIPVVIKNDEIVAVGKNNTIFPDKFSGHLPYPIGCLRGFNAARALLNDKQKVVLVDTVEQLYRLLDMGRVEIIIDARTRAEYNIDTMQLNNLTIIEPPLQSVALYHYVHIKNRDLILNLTEVLREMEDEGLIPYTIPPDNYY